MCQRAGNVVEADTGQAQKQQGDCPSCRLTPCSGLRWASCHLLIANCSDLHKEKPLKRGGTEDAEAGVISSASTFPPTTPPFPSLLSSLASADSTFKHLAGIGAEPSEGKLRKRSLFCLSRSLFLRFLRSSAFQRFWH